MARLQYKTEEEKSLSSYKQAALLLYKIAR